MNCHLSSVPSFNQAYHGIDATQSSTQHANRCVLWDLSLQGGNRVRCRQNPVCPAQICWHFCRQSSATKEYIVRAQYEAMSSVQNVAVPGPARIGDFGIYLYNLYMKNRRLLYQIIKAVLKI